MSLPEVLLWKHLKGSPDGLSFRRQHSVAPNVIVDFYCAKAKLCIEIDGKSHEMGRNAEIDAQRDALLRSSGFEIVRIPATDVLRSPESVAEMLVRLCQR
jgi:very-short-patch-repair endonuclease